MADKKPTDGKGGILTKYNTIVIIEILLKQKRLIIKDYTSTTAICKNHKNNYSINADITDID